MRVMSAAEIDGLRLRESRLWSGMNATARATAHTATVISGQNAMMATRKTAPMRSHSFCCFTDQGYLHDFTLFEEWSEKGMELEDRRISFCLTRSRILLNPATLQVSSVLVITVTHHPAGSSTPSFPAGPSSLRRAGPGGHHALGRFESPFLSMTPGIQRSLQTRFELKASTRELEEAGSVQNGEIR